MATDDLRDHRFGAMDGEWIGSCYSFFHYNCLFFTNFKTPWINDFFETR